jgi:hypothetical protein
MCTVRVDASPIVGAKTRARRMTPASPRLPPPPRALFNLIKKLTKETELSWALRSLPLYGDS